MGDVKWERYGALGGVVFVVLDVIVALLGGEPPATDAGRSEGVRSPVLRRQGPGDRGRALALRTRGHGAHLGFGSLWRRMVRSEDGAARLAVVSLVGLALAGALSLTSSSVSAAVSLRIDEVGDDLLVVHTLAELLLAASGFGVATHLLATSALGARTGTLPLWAVAVGGLSALGFVGSAVLGATGTDDASGMVGVVGFGLWCVWILGVSFRMWSDPSLGAATSAS